MWYSLEKIEKTGSKGLIATVTVGKNSPWFSGHFPGDPTLPGIAQLAIVFDMIKQITRDDLKLFEINRVKFKKIIRPEEKLNIVVNAVDDKSNAYTFQIEKHGEPACKGMMRVNKT